MLTMKKGAVSPFYLQLACETLRNFASFDKVFTFTFLKCWEWVEILQYTVYEYSPKLTTDNSTCV